MDNFTLGKKVVWSILAVTAALMLDSCMSYPVDIERNAGEVLVWDETLPKEQSVGLSIPQFVRVTSYNGISVDWRTGKVVYLPPGKINLTITLMDRNSWGAFVWKEDLPFEWTFRAGDRYTLRDRTEWGLFPGLTLQNMNEKLAWEDQITYRFPSPKIVLSPPVQNHGSQGSATLVFGKSLMMRAYNDDGEQKSMYPSGVWEAITVTVPAGGTSMNFDYCHYIQRFSTDVLVYGQNLELNYSFEAGKEYTIAGYHKRQDSVIEYGVAIWDYASADGNPRVLQKGTILASWKLGEIK
ncbi:MAG: hypothetical protein LBO65_07170 [Spirochaetaceae bacterium]|nr:hypothetical protein [Spirochaetaceae bacterium]